MLCRSNQTMVRFSLSIFLFISVTFICAENTNGNEFFLVRRWHISKDELRTTSGQSCDVSVSGCINQRLDHFHNENEVALNHVKLFGQRYYQNDRFFNEKTGPIFLLIGGESALSEYYKVNGMWNIWAKKYNALCFYVEHRYYGNTHPTPNVDTENLKYLTFRQALGDLKFFIEHKRMEMDLNKDSHKWIVFGGSYAGRLAAWMRFNHPDLVYGAIASSAPMFLKVNFMEYNERIIYALSKVKYGPECIDAIRSAANKISYNFFGPHQNVHCAEMTNLFNIHPKLNCSNIRDKKYFFEVVTNRISSCVQYNHHGGKTMNDVCETMRNKELGEPINRLAALMNQLIKSENIASLYVDYGGKNEHLKETDWSSKSVVNGERQFNYQICTEIGTLPTSDSVNQLLGHYLDFKTMLNMFCTDVFGKQYNDVKLFRGVYWSNKNYNGSVFFNRTVFTVGTLDPWFSNQMPKDNENGNVVIEIEGGSHCDDMESPYGGETNELIAARLEIENNLEKWIAE